MACDPKQILSDLYVAGIILTYAEVWTSGNSKTLATTNTNTLTDVYNFNYKNIAFYNTFNKTSAGVFTSATIRTGTFNNSAPTAGTLIETRTF